MLRLKVHNLTMGVTLAGRAEIAATSATRRRGLLGRTGLERGEGLWIVPCEAVHGIGMKFPIDVVFLDRKRRVVKVARNLAGWRFAGSWRAHSVLELPCGALAAPGDQIELEKYES